MKHAESALEGTDCPHYEWHTMLRSRGGKLSLKIYSGSSPQRKGSTLRLSFSEEGDREDVDEFSQNVRLHKQVVNK